MWCCGTDVLKADGKYRKSVFDKKQIDSLKRKFNFVSGNQQFITPESFKKNIGFLGIRAVTSFLDRIFNSFDIDGDHKISFDDFIEYMQILKDGSDDQKAQISFNLIHMNQSCESMPQGKKQRRSSYVKSNQGTFQLQNIPSKRKKLIDMPMFERFFQDFYKSWSSITNQSIPKDTKIALKKFISQLYKKVESDGRKAIDLDYYKILYKDRQFMMAFRQINSKLGNFFIKTTNNQFQKNVTLIHKILKKINTIFEKACPLMNESFLQDLQKPKSKKSAQSPSSSSKRNQHQGQINEQYLDKYFYDAKRYQMQNVFQGKEDQKSFNIQYQMKIYNENTDKKQRTSTKAKLSEDEPKKTVAQPLKFENPLYKMRLQDHVSFLQRKLLFIQNNLKQIIQQSKQMYDQMHQQFLKILQKIQKEHHLKQKQMREQNRQDYYNGRDQLDRQKQKGKNQNQDRLNQHKRHDKKVFFGDKNFNLVLQIMVGIQMSVRSVSGFQEIIFQEPEDFNLKHTFQMDYGHFGQNDILYTFTDYAPNVFNHVRKIYQIDNQHYINSIGPNKMMSSLIMGRMASFQQLVSQGKSGSFFYHTQDGKYLIKTISQKEFYFMRKILQKYFRHVKSNSQTLMPRFFGLHKITSTMKKYFVKDNKMAYYLIVMNNFFNTKELITDKFDLKGSWVNRENTSGSGVKKDINFMKQKRRINIQKQEKVKIFQIIEKDTKFFAQNNILDYSLLVGFVESIQVKKNRTPKTNSLFEIGNEFLFRSQENNQENLHILQEKKSMNFKFRSESKRSQFYLIGIIDILTEYNTKKQAQHLFKSCIYDSKGISAVPPQEYKQRFLRFLRQDVFRIPQKINSKSKSKTYIQQKNDGRIQRKSKNRTKTRAFSDNQQFEQLYKSSQPYHNANKKQNKRNYL